jgi:GrpB-like predicted nucleotidyltransferase (UPF0157 family)
MPRTIDDKLAFRDYLRAHPQRAAEYGALTQRLALEHRHDNIACMHGKDASFHLADDRSNRITVHQMVTHTSGMTRSPALGLD